MQSGGDIFDSHLGEAIQSAIVFINRARTVAQRPTNEYE